MHSSQSKDLVQTVKEFSDDNDFYEKVSKVTSPLVFYHNSCKTIAIYTLQSQNKVIKSLQKNKSWKYYHQQAFNEMKMFFSEEVINKKRCFPFTYLCKYYAEFLEEVLEEHNEQEILEETEILQKAVSILRETILNMKKNDIPGNIASLNSLNGECEIPKHVSEFYCFLLGGYKHRRRTSTNFIRKVDSLAEDLIYNVSNGFIKTKKHITLWMTLKSLTSSRKIVDTTNKCGHCSSYHIIKELEIRVTTSLNRSQLCPRSSL